MRNFKVLSLFVVFSSILLGLFSGFACSSSNIKDLGPMGSDGTKSDRDRSILSEAEKQYQQDLNQFKTQIDVINRLLLLKSYKEALPHVQTAIEKARLLVSQVDTADEKRHFWSLIVVLESYYQNIMFTVTLREMDSLPQQLAFKNGETPSYASLMQARNQLSKMNSMIGWKLDADLTPIQEKVAQALPSLWDQLFNVSNHVILANMEKLSTLNPSKDSGYLPLLVEIKNQILDTLDIPITAPFAPLRETLVDIYTQIIDLERDIMYLNDMYRI